MDRETPAQKFHRLVWPHREAVLRVASILAGDPGEAEDLAQETLLKAFKAIDRFVGADARAWTLAILRNARIDRLRSRASAAGEVSLAAIEFDPPDVPPADREPAWERPDALLEAFGDAQIIDALRDLPEDIRWTLLLVDVEGLDHADAAGVMGVPVGTVKSRAHRGRSMLRESLLPLARERRIARD